MTATERNAVRGRLLADLLDAIDDEKAHCGRLGEIGRTLERLSTAVGAKQLRSQFDDQHGHVFFVVANETSSLPASTAIQMPSIEDLAKAVDACHAATQRRATAMKAAEDAGVSFDGLIRR